MGAVFGFGLSPYRTVPSLKGFFIFRLLMKYSDKLKDPRWQKKRLEILEDREWTCENCGNRDKELHVHHKHYEYNKDPWNYDDNRFFVFCKNCHSEWHGAKKELDKIIGNIGSSANIERIIGYALVMGEGDVFPSGIDNNFFKHCGMADFFRTKVDVISDIEKEATGKSWPLGFGKNLWLQVMGKS